MKRNECGLTLVEVLVAAVILGIIAAGFFAAFDVGARLTAAGREQVKAVHLAQEKLEELRGVPYASVNSVAYPAYFAEACPGDPTVKGFTYGVAMVDNGTSKTVTVAVYYTVGATSEQVNLTAERSNL